MHWQQSWILVPASSIGQLRFKIFFCLAELKCAQINSHTKKLRSQTKQKTQIQRSQMRLLTFVLVIIFLFSSALIYQGSYADRCTGLSGGFQSSPRVRSLFTSQTPAISQLHDAIRARALHQKERQKQQFFQHVYSDYVSRLDTQQEPAPKVISLNADSQIRGIVGTNSIQYLGVNYAKYNGRWQPSTTYKADPCPGCEPLPWKGTFDANKFGPACVQNFAYFNASLDITEEKCLSLNIYVPNVKSETAPLLLPVIFVIHGDDYNSGANFMYDGDHWVKSHFDVQNMREQIVVVPNYRYVN